MGDYTRMADVARQLKEADYEENIREAIDNIIAKIDEKHTAVFITESLNKSCH